MYFTSELMRMAKDLTPALLHFLSHCRFTAENEVAMCVEY